MERMTNSSLAAPAELDLSAFALAIARVLVASLFLVAGARKLLAWTATVAYFGKLGLVMPEMILLLVLALEFAGGILLAIGWRLPLVATALAVFTFGAAIAAHAFWSAEPAQFSGQLNNFLKNVAIAGGLIQIATTSILMKRRA